GVGDLDVGVEGQCFVCGCHRVGVEGLAVGGGAAGQVGAVEGGFAGASLPCGFWVLVVGGGVGLFLFLGLFFFLGQVGALGAGCLLAGLGGLLGLCGWVLGGCVFGLEFVGFGVGYLGGVGMCGRWGVAGDQGCSGCTPHHQGRSGGQGQ